MSNKPRRNKRKVSKKRSGRKSSKVSRKRSRRKSNKHSKRCVTKKGSTRRRRHYGELTNIMSNYRPQNEMSLAQKQTGFSENQMTEHMKNIPAYLRDNFYT